MTIQANYISHDGKKIRLTNNQRSHIAFFHPEVLQNGDGKIETTLAQPEIIASGATTDTRISYKFFASTPVTSKYLAVVVKMLNGEGFIITAYFTESVKRRKIIWKKQS